MTLISIKVSASHIYMHDCESNLDNCEICELAIYNQNIEFSYSDKPFVFENNSQATFYRFTDSNFKSVLVKTSFNTNCFGRPPPSLV